MKAKLKFPVLGHIEIRLIEKHDFKWLAELIETDLKIEVYEDEFMFEGNSPQQSNELFLATQSQSEFVPLLQNDQ